MFPAQLIISGGKVLVKCMTHRPDSPGAAGPARESEIADHSESVPGPMIFERFAYSATGGTHLYILRNTAD